MRSVARGGRRAVALGAAAASLAAMSVLAPIVTSASAAPANMTPSALALKHHWVSENGNYSTGDPMYAIDGNGVVHLSGSIGGGTAGQYAFVLPPAARPASSLYLSIYTGATTLGYLFINTAGQVFPEGSQPTAYTSLSGISFPSASSSLAEHGVALQNGWASEDSAYGTGDPSYAVDAEGIVHLSGSLAGGSDGSVAFTLPVADRPSKVSYFNVYTFGGTYGAVSIATNGAVSIFGGPDADATSFTSLAGLTFRDKGSILGAATQKTENGWEGNTYDSGPPSASRDQYGFVHLSGGLDNTNTDGGTGQVAFVLPKADWPSHRVYQPIFTQGVEIGLVYIDTAGEVSFYGTPTTGSTDYSDLFASLAGITFEAGV